MEGAVGTRVQATPPLLTPDGDDDLGGEDDLPYEPTAAGAVRAKDEGME